jgi:large subunit ribosomal protein L31
MKPNIHPDYHPVVFQDATTGKMFLTRSTITSSRFIEWETPEGVQTYPLVVVEVSSDSHPFWTGAESLTPRVESKSSTADTAAVAPDRP